MLILLFYSGLTRDQAYISKTHLFSTDNNKNGKEDFGRLLPRYGQQPTGLYFSFR